MSINLNIHPNYHGEEDFPKTHWKEITAYLYSAEHGSCIRLVFDNADLSIHYGGESFKKDFVSRFKTAVAALPEN